MHISWNLTLVKSIILNIVYDNKTAERVPTKKFIGLHINNTCNWKKHAEYFNCKLSSAWSLNNQLIHVHHLTKLYVFECYKQATCVSPPAPS